jgi:hypothetical protein
MAQTASRMVLVGQIIENTTPRPPQLAASLILGAEAKHQIRRLPKVMAILKLAKVSLQVISSKYQITGN